MVGSLDHLAMSIGVDTNPLPAAEVDLDHSRLLRCGAGPKWRLRRYYVLPPRRETRRCDTNRNQTSDGSCVSLLRTRLTPPREQKIWCNRMLARDLGHRGTRCKRFGDNLRLLLRRPTSPPCPTHQIHNLHRLADLMPRLEVTCFLNPAILTRRSSPDGHVVSACHNLFDAVELRSRLNAWASERRGSDADSCTPEFHARLIRVVMPRWGRVRRPGAPAHNRILRRHRPRRRVQGRHFAA